MFLSEERPECSCCSRQADSRCLMKILEPLERGPKYLNFEEVKILKEIIPMVSDSSLLCKNFYSQLYILSRDPQESQSRLPYCKLSTITLQDFLGHCFSKLLVFFGIKTGRKPQSQEETDVLGVGEAFGCDRPFQT